MTPQTNQVTKELLSNPDTFATTLIVIVIDHYGTEALNWSAQTLILELLSDFQVVVPQVNIDKIMAANCILTSDIFFKNLPKFIDMCNILSGTQFDPTVLELADPFEMAWAITEALLLYPPEEDEPFVDEIRYYMGAILFEDGIVNPPDVLKIAIYEKGNKDPLNVSADDPEMYGAFFQNQTSKSEEITVMLKGQLAELFEQLGSLKLRNGDTSNLLKRIQEASLSE